MSEIRNLTRNGETFYPLTCTEGLVNRDGNVVGEINDIFDISEYNASGTPQVLAKYDTLSLALAAVPTSKQKGGMTIRYVQSYDNKYVQYRCITQSFSTNPEDWAIEMDDILIENAKWIRVVTDKEGRILAGIKADGSIEWSIGIPTPVKKYIEEWLSTKVDKREGKGLIDSEFADGISYIDNPKFICVCLDKEERILFAIESNGNFLFGCGVPQQIVAYFQQNFEKFKLANVPSIVAFLGELIVGNENLQELLDKKADGEYIDNSKYIRLYTDKEGRILGGRKANGMMFENVGYETPLLNVAGNTSKGYTDKENRIAISLDSLGRVLSYIDKDGARHENAGFFVKDMDIPAAIKELQKGPDWEQSPRFIQISDPHNDNRQTVENGVNAEGRMALLANMINDENKNGNLDFVICTGDCCLPGTNANGERDNYLSLFRGRVIDKVPNIFLPVVGNHDGYTDEEWYNCFKLPKQYSATVGQCYLIVLNVYRDSIEWSYSPSNPNADAKGYVPCSILDAEGVAHTRDLRFTTVDTDFLEEQLKIATKLGKIPIVCYHTFETGSAVDENAANASVSTAFSLMNTYGCKLILYGHSHKISNTKIGNQWRCNPGWFGPINDYNYNVSPWAINLFENVDGYFAVNNIILGHDYPDSDPEYHDKPGGAYGHIAASETITNLWESRKVRSMFNF